MIHAVSSLLPETGLAPPAHARSSRTGSTAFAEIFAKELVRPASVRFSAHAVERLGQRGIRLTADQENRLGELVDRAAAKGSRESLLLMDGLAFVVNVPKRMVITAARLSGTEETAVFTNIDCVVVAPEERTLPQETVETGPAPYWGSPCAAER